MVWSRSGFPVPACYTTLLSLPEIRNLVPLPSYISGFPIFTVILQYYYQHPGVAHHTAEIIWDIVDLPVRLHHWRRSRASFQYHYVFGTASHATSGLAWSGSEAVMAEWKPFVILTGCRDDLLELAPLTHHAVAHTHEICIVSSMMSPRDTRNLGRCYKL